VTSERCVTYRKSAFYAHTYNPNSNLSFSTTNLPQCPNKVNRRCLKDIGEHNREDVLINYGHQYQHSDLAFMGAMINKLNEERQDIRKWATDSIKTRMLDKAIVSNMRYRNEREKKFQDIGASWKEDPSSDNAKKIYCVMFRDYEGQSVAWSRDLEKEYMDRCAREYIVVTDEKKQRAKGVTRNS
jgi:hypothetical protein